MTPSQTKLLEDLRSGAVRLVPGEVLEADAVVTLDMVAVMKKELVVLRDTPNLNLGMAMSRAILARQGESASPDLTPALVEMIEGLVRERDEAKAQLRTGETQYGVLVQQNNHLAARALTAEAEQDALREALAPFGSGAVIFYENEPDDCVLSLGRWKYQEDGRARFYADVQFTVADVRRARALTKEKNDVGE